MSARPFEPTVDVETPEMVVLTYSLAGVGSRVLAGLTDLLICVGTLIAVPVAVVLLGGPVLPVAAGSARRGLSLPGRGHA